MQKMIKVNLIIVLMSLMISGCATQQGNIYTPEDIVETCGFKTERSRDFEMAGVESVNVMSTKSSIDERFDEMDFYIFESKADAKRAFNKTDYWFEDIEEEGDDYRKGWLAGVCDANVEKYEYLTGNMIILVQTQVVSCWAEPIEPADEGITEDKPEVKAVEEEVVDKWSQSYRDGIIELMRETFK